MTPNMQAFLDMIAVSEGTKHLGENGYNVLVGGTLFDGYADHPRKLVHLNATLASTAAGRYQILARYFDSYKKTLHLPDFSPASQDEIAIQMIREQGALYDVERGHIASAIDKCRNIWASLPGAGYGQHENTIEKLTQVYTQHGGALV